MDIRDEIDRERPAFDYLDYFLKLAAFWVVVGLLWRLTRIEERLPVLAVTVFACVVAGGFGLWLSWRLGRLTHRIVSHLAAGVDRLPIRVLLWLLPLAMYLLLLGALLTGIAGLQ